MALALNWLVLAILGAGYLLKRLPKDYGTAKYNVRCRVLVLQFKQNVRYMTNRYQASALAGIEFKDSP